MLRRHPGSSWPPLSNRLAGTIRTDANPDAPSLAAGVILGFDFGRARIGVAVGQRLTGRARPLEPLNARDDAGLEPAIDRLCAEWKPDCLVIGLPLSMDGSETETSRAARAFADRLRRGELDVADEDHDPADFDAAKDRILDPDVEYQGVLYQDPDSVSYGEVHGLTANMAELPEGAPEDAMDLVREFY